MARKRFLERVKRNLSKSAENQLTFASGYCRFGRKLGLQFSVNTQEDSDNLVKLVDELNMDFPYEIRIIAEISATTPTELCEDDNTLDSLKEMASKRMS